MSVTDQEIREAISHMLTGRLPQATACPSEVARALEPHGWRELMPQVRAVAFAMATDGALSIRQHGLVVSPGDSLRGPIRLGRPVTAPPLHVTTPDGRYIIVRGRLWRTANPHLTATARAALIDQLMDARRSLRGRPTDEKRRIARSQVDRAKRALGERGPAWWTDGTPDFNRKLVKNTPYADWFRRLSPTPSPS